MFTGIVEEIGSVVTAAQDRLVIAARQIVKKMEQGDSVAVNGICLTVTDFTDSQFSVDVMPETLNRTNLGGLKPGDRVNLEKPLTLEKGLGGHLVQGHIDGTGKVAGVTKQPGAMLLKIQAPEEILSYIVEKGFVAIDGVSLTVTNKDTDSFSVSIVDFTRQHTIIDKYQVGAPVNIEVDVIAKYMAEYMSKINRPERLGVTESYLKEHGFLEGFGRVQ